MSSISQRLTAVLVLVTLLATFSGCRQPAVPPYRGQQVIAWDGLQRTFNVHLPPAYSTSRTWPLVVVLHGGGGNASQVERSTGFSEVADREGFIVIYPDGSGVFESALLTWNAGHCCGYALENDIDDVGFFKAMVGDIKANLNIDPGRVYVTGMSNGAMMAYRIGAECPDIVAAIAPIAGAIGGRPNADAPLWLPSQPRQPVSVLAIHGTADPHVLYEGGHGPQTIGDRVDVSVKESIDFWRAANGTSAQAPVTTSADGVHRAEYASQDDIVVELLTIDGGGHVWPGAYNDPLQKINATEIIWQFFAER